MPLGPLLGRNMLKVLSKYLYLLIVTLIVISCGGLENESVGFFDVAEAAPLKEEMSSSNLFKVNRSPESAKEGDQITKILVILLIERGFIMGVPILQLKV